MPRASHGSQEDITMISGDLWVLTECVILFGKLAGLRSMADKHLLRWAPVCASPGLGPKSSQGPLDTARGP